MNNLENKKIVTKIPADARKASRVEPGRKLKVAAYCRVSTDDEDQLNSYRVQKDYYSKHIISNDNCCNLFSFVFTKCQPTGS